MSVVHIDRLIDRLVLDGHEIVGPGNERLDEAIVAIVGGRIWDSDTFDSAPKLIGLCRTGIGVDAIDLAEATRRGIAVTNTPDAPTVSTAEHTIALIFAVAKTIRPHVARLRQGSGEYAARSEAIELDGLTLGLLGYGRIARRVARIAAAVGMRIVAYDPFVWSAEDAVLVEFDELLRTADVLSLHAPLVADTERIIDADALARCKPGVVIVNCGRGGLIDHDALVDSLDAGHVFGVGLDVTDPEPLPPSHTLLSRENVLVTPHIASATVVGRQRMLDQALEQAAMILAGTRPTNLVNTDLLAPHWQDLEA